MDELAQEAESRRNIHMAGRKSKSAGKSRKRLKKGKSLRATKTLRGLAKTGFMD
jgi:hypothetical protein